MAVTFRQMLNRVLNNLGEPELPSTDTALSEAYHLLLRNIFNQVKEECEDSHNWRALRTTQAVTVASGGNSIVISNANERSRLVRVQDARLGGERALVFDVTTTGAEARVKEVDIAFLLMRRKQAPADTGQYAAYFAVDNRASDNVYLEVFPLSTAAQNYEVELFVPQARFEGTSSDIDTSITVPHMPIELGMTYFAMEERGEALGPQGLFTEQRYRTALQNAIARDSAEQGNYELVPV